MWWEDFGAWTLRQGRPGKVEPGDLKSRTVRGDNEIREKIFIAPSGLERGGFCEGN